MWYVYILKCKDGRLYTGITRDLERRLQQHRRGTASRFTRSFGAGRFVHRETRATVGAALRREHEIKRWSRREKLAFLAAQRRREGPAEKKKGRRAAV